MRHAAFLLTLLAASCGKVEPLQPVAGHSLPPKPQEAARAPTTDELLTPPTIARPTRTEDTLRRSEEREDDRFDLPPS
jgi:hypothetical protein